ncbi:hypothetical protein H4582DRAFT_1950197, partial [Lactarius indigo]
MTRSKDHKTSLLTTKPRRNQGGTPKPGQCGRRVTSVPMSCLQRPRFGPIFSNRKQLRIGGGTRGLSWTVYRVGRLCDSFGVPIDCESSTLCPIGVFFVVGNFKGGFTEGARERRCMRALPGPWPEEQPHCEGRVVGAPGQPELVAPHVFVDSVLNSLCIWSRPGP